MGSPCLAYGILRKLCSSFLDARSTTHEYTIVRATVVIRVAVEDGWNIACSAEIGLVVLSRTRVPLPTILDMNLARGMVVAEEHSWKDGHDVLLLAKNVM